MATSNFNDVKTSKIFAFGMRKYYTDEDVQDLGLDESMVDEYDKARTDADFDWSIYHCKELLTLRGWREPYTDKFRNIGRARRCGAKAIAEKTAAVVVAGVNIDVTIQAGYTCAYYEGATFDVEISADVYDRDWRFIWNYDDADEITPEDVVADNWCNNCGLSKIQAANIVAKIAAAVNSLRSEAEEVFAECCEHTLCERGHFSNGECVYREI